MTLPEDEHPVQALTFYGPDESFTNGIQMRCHGQSADGLDARVPEDLPERLSKEWVPIMDDVLFVLQEAGEVVRHIPCHLLHPSSIGLLRNADNFNLPCSIINTDQDIIPSQSLPGVNFLREKIDGREGFPV